MRAHSSILRKLAAAGLFAGLTFTALAQIKPPASDFREEKIGIDMVIVKGGTFDMGCRADAHAADCWGDEKPVRKVTVSDFHIGKFPITQRQWTAVMGSNPSKVKGDDMPVAPVSWDQAQEFINKLNSMTGKKYRLPTEAEWEYAARGGSQSKGYKYAGSNGIHDVAWYLDNSGNKIQPVGLKQANELGLYDMSGNVWEWTGDWVGNYGSITQNNNPTGPAAGLHRIARGGSFRNEARRNRITNRGGDKLNVSFGDLGLRVVIGVDVASAAGASSGGAITGGASAPIKYGSLVDQRDRRVYRTVTIGNQTWMAQNLNYETADSWCYGKNSSNCDTYGRLYTWNAAIRACPAGWHLPSDAEWETLVKYVDPNASGNDNNNAGTKLKSKSGWNNNGNGTDNHGFSALPGGFGGSGDFNDAGYIGYWWSATEFDANYARYRNMYNNTEYVYWYYNDKTRQFSSRCLKD